MTNIPDAAKLIKGGFIRIDPRTNAIVQILAFQINPTTLSRGLVNPPEITPNFQPHEVVRFTVVLDAQDPPQGNGVGIYPLLSALELLLYAPGGPAETNPLVVFAWGHLRLLPIQVRELQIVEQKFDVELNPVHAEIEVTLQVLKDADLPPDSVARRLWDTHLLKLQQLASRAPAATLADLGLSAV